MSTLQKMTYTQVYAELQDINYHEAIKHYNDLKQSFLNQYQYAAINAHKDTPEEFLNQIIDEINAEPIEEQVSLTELLYKDIEDNISLILEGFKGNFSEERKRLQQMAKDKSEKGKQEFSKALDSIFDENQMYEIIIQNLQKYNISKNGFSVSDILNQIKSYRKKILLTRINASAKYYKRSTKGYVREAMVHNAFAKLNEYLGGKVVDIHAGNLTSNNNIDTVYDEYIDLFNNIGESFSTVVNTPIDYYGTGFGMQVKSWTAPWEKEKNNPWDKYSMSSQASLFNYISSLYQDLYNNGDSWSWIAGVRLLESNMVSAIGPNQVGFITGKHFYWTGELISNFRQLEYFYAFVFDKEHKATKRTSWQQIQA